MKLFILSIFIFCFSLPALAQETQSLEQTRVEVDQEASVVRIIVEGREVAQVTSSGLYVVGDVNYSGIIRDSGSDVKQKTMANEFEMLDSDASP